MAMNALHVKAALMMLTRLPVNDKYQQLNAEHFKHCWPLYPCVGILIGALSATSLFLLASVLPNTVATLLSLLIAILLTGAIHEDGFADACDGIFSGKATEQAFMIMKDSRLGAFGVIGLLFNLLLKASLLLALVNVKPSLACLALICSHCLARFSPLVMMASVKANHQGQSKLSNNLATPKTQTLTLLFITYLGLLWVLCCLASTALTLELGSITLAVLISSIVALICASLSAYYIQHKFNRFNGDCLGFSEQITEIMVLLSFSLFIVA